MFTEEQIDKIDRYSQLSKFIVQRNRRPERGRQGQINGY
jgi:hypothetical protein